MPTYTRPIDASLLATGLVGTLGYTVLAADKTTVLVARTTAGITEDSASGQYYASVAGWDTSWSGFIVWDAEAGTLAKESFQAEVSSGVAGPTAEAIRQEMDANSTKLALVDVAISTRPTADQNATTLLAKALPTPVAGKPSTVGAWMSWLNQWFNGPGAKDDTAKTLVTKSDAGVVLTTRPYATSGDSETMQVAS